MAKSSKPKEIVVVGSKIKELDNPPAGLTLNIGDQIHGTLSWDVDLIPSAANPPPGYQLAFFDDFEPFATLVIPGHTFIEDPLGIVIGVNDNLPNGNDEVLVSFSFGDSGANHYQFNLHLLDPSGTALNAAGLTTPLHLSLADFSTATLSLSEIGGRTFATATIDSLQSSVIPEPTGIALYAALLGTLAIGRLVRIVRM